MANIQITAAELNDLIQKNAVDGAIIDVRTADEFARGHIAGAINIPVDTIGARANELKSYNKVYLYCLSGGRSIMAQKALEQAGLNNTLDIKSGLLAWRMGQYPLVSG